jgi:hypothetical protein
VWFTGAVLQRALKQPVGKPRVAWQQRTVEIGSDRRSKSATLVAALPVIPESVHHAPERVSFFVKFGSARVILEPGNPPRGPIDEIAFEQHVADETMIRCLSANGKQPCAGHLTARDVTVRMPKQLIPATDRQQRASGFYEAAQCGPTSRDVRRYELLITILASADVDEIRLARKLSSVINGAHRKLNATPGGTPIQHCDITAVGVDIEQLRVEMGDRQLHDLTR